MNKNNLVEEIVMMFETKKADIESKQDHMELVHKRIYGEIRDVPLAQLDFGELLSLLDVEMSRMLSHQQIVEDALFTLIKATATDVEKRQLQNLAKRFLELLIEYGEVSTNSRLKAHDIVQHIRSKFASSS